MGILPVPFQAANIGSQREGGMNTDDSNEARQNKKKFLYSEIQALLQEEIT